MTLKTTLSGASIAAFAIATGEMFLMTSPFAAYFYGLYSPLLGLSNSLPWLAWLSEFWLPHIVPGFVASAGFALGVTLAAAGVVSFVAHASYLYWMKFRVKKIATRLLYSQVRHPQYTSLIVAGAGFALLWPRFVNLVLFLAMSGAYYALARSEEARMRRQFPFEYAEYARHKPLFFPGAPGRQARRVLAIGAADRVRTATFAVLIAAAAIACALGVRAASVRRLETIVVDNDSSALLVAYSTHIPSRILEAAGDIARRDREAGARLVYVTGSHETARHLLIDSGVKLDALASLGDPAGGYYVIRSVVEGAVSGAEALGLGSLRRLDGLYVLQDAGGSTGISQMPLSEGSRYRHAAVPLL